MALFPTKWKSLTLFHSLKPVIDLSLRIIDRFEKDYHRARGCVLSPHFLLQTDSSETSVNNLLSLLFTTKFSRSHASKLKTTRIYLLKFPTAIEGLGVSYSCWILSRCYYIYTCINNFICQLSPESKEETFRLKRKRRILKPLRPLDVLLYRSLLQFSA